MVLGSILLMLNLDPRTSVLLAFCISFVVFCWVIYRYVSRSVSSVMTSKRYSRDRRSILKGGLLSLIEASAAATINVTLASVNAAVSYASTAERGIVAGEQISRF